MSTGVKKPRKSARTFSGPDVQRRIEWLESSTKIAEEIRLESGNEVADEILMNTRNELEELSHTNVKLLGESLGYEGVGNRVDILRRIADEKLKVPYKFAREMYTRANARLRDEVTFKRSGLDGTFERFDESGAALDTSYKDEPSDASTIHQSSTADSRDEPKDESKGEPKVEPKGEPMGDSKDDSKDDSKGKLSLDDLETKSGATFAESKAPVGEEHKEEGGHREHKEEGGHRKYESFNESFIRSQPEFRADSYVPPVTQSIYSQAEEQKVNEGQRVNERGPRAPRSTYPFVAVDKEIARRERLHQFEGQEQHTTPGGADEEFIGSRAARFGMTADEAFESQNNPATFARNVRNLESARRGKEITRQVEARRSTHISNEVAADRDIDAAYEDIVALQDRESRTQAARAADAHATAIRRGHLPSPIRAPDSPDSRRRPYYPDISPDVPDSRRRPYYPDEDYNTSIARANVARDDLIDGDLVNEIAGLENGIVHNRARIDNSRANYVNDFARVIEVDQLSHNMKKGVAKTEIMQLGMGQSSHHYPVMFREAAHYYFRATDYGELTELYVSGIPSKLSTEGQVIYLENPDPSSLLSACQAILGVYGRSLGISRLVVTDTRNPIKLFQQHRELVQLVKAYGVYTSKTNGMYQPIDVSGGGGGSAEPTFHNGLAVQKTFLAGAGAVIGKGSLGQLNAKEMHSAYDGDLRKKKRAPDDNTLGGVQTQRTMVASGKSGGQDPIPGPYGSVNKKQRFSFGSNVTLRSENNNSVESLKALISGSKSYTLPTRSLKF